MDQSSASSSFILYHYWRSSCSWRVRWALNLKGISYTKVAVNLLEGEQQAPAYLTQNPAGSVPVLQHGGLVLMESLAIIEWLDERYPSPPLLPQSPDDRAQARSIALQVAAGIQPLQNLKMLQYVAKDKTAQHEFARYWNAQGLAALEKTIHPLAGTYALGGQLTIADLCLIPQCYNARRFGVQLEDFPTINRIYQQCMSEPACHEATPEQQAEASRAP